MPEEPSDRSLGRRLADPTGKGALDAIIGIVVIVVGIYLAFWVLGLVLRIVVLVVVIAVAIFLFTRLVQGARKLGGG